MQNKFILALLAVCAGITGAIALSATANAQETRPDDTYIEALRECQAKTDPEARLTCFDTTAATIVGASDKGELRIVDSGEVRETRRKLFGFTLPDFGIFGHKAKDGDIQEEEIDAITTTIARARSTSEGYLLTTADGAVWQIDNPPRRLMSPKVGQSLEIRNAALGSFFLRIDGQTGVKGRRIR